MIIPTRKLKELPHVLPWKRILYTLGFFFFCLIDNRVKNCSGLDGGREIFRDLTGVVMAALIISHYSLKEFKKYRLAYLVWTVTGVLGGAFVYFLGRGYVPYSVDLLVLIVDAVLFGYILICTYIKIIVEKHNPQLNRKFAVLWCTMMLLMIVSGGGYLWPFCYFVMFGCFYLTDFTGQEQADLFHGMLDGVILSFFIFQGHSFVLRPYDCVDARYKGFFANPNWNSLYYLEVLGAVLTKLIYVSKKHCGKLIKLYYWLGAGVLLAFEFMTIGRSGWITAFIMTVLFLAFMGRLEKKKRYIRNGAALAVCFALAFPVCFSAARYLPPMFHHVLWFYGEWNEDRVHSWNKWDSEKFVDVDEFFDAAQRRIVRSVEDLVRNLPETPPDIKRVQIAKSAVESTAMPQVQRREAVLTEEEAKDSYIIRSTIYKYYFKNLKLRGQPYEEQGFQISPVFWVGHAHNIFLQFGTDFGIIVMVLFACLTIGGCVDYKRQYYAKGSEYAVGFFFFILIPIVFGMFEYSWGVGSLSITMLFVAWRGNIVNEQEQ